jgi:hypothetical protein
MGNVVNLIKIMTNIAIRIKVWNIIFCLLLLYILTVGILGG